MTKTSEIALQTIKAVMDRAVSKGNIFDTTDQVIDSINAYNYLVRICNEHDLAAQTQNTNHQQNKSDAITDKT